MFLQTVHLDANDIAVRPEHSVLVEEEADVETIQAVRRMTHALDELQAEVLKRCSSWLSRVGNAVAVSLLLLRCEGIPYIFSEEDISAGVRLIVAQPRRKSSDAVHALSIVFALVRHI